MQILSVSSGPRRSGFAIALVAFLSACTVQLAPDFEESIVAGLNDYNQAIMTHIATVSRGTEPGLNEAQQSAYDKLKGQGRALKIIIGARPQPNSALTRWLGNALSDDVQISADGRTVSNVSFLDVPTDDQIDRILEQLLAMEDEE